MVVLAVFLLCAFFIFGLLVGSLGLTGEKFLTVLLCFLLILMLIGDISLLFIFILGTIVGSILSHSIRKITAKKKKEVIKL